MIIPVRCFTCGKVLADKYDWYVRETQKLGDKPQSTAVEGGAPKKKNAQKQVAEEKLPGVKYFDTVHTGEIMDKLGLTRYCCRRHLLGAVDMMDVI